MGESRTAPDSIHARAALLPDGWAADVRLGWADGRFVGIDVGVPPGADAARVEIALPGMANLHSHAFQRGMAGLAETRGPEGDSFWTWRTLMYRFVARLTPDDLQAIAAQAYVEMLEAGFTRVGEFHYLHHDLDGRAYADPAEMAGRIAAAADLTGIGLTLLPVFYGQGGFGGAPAGEAQSRFVTDADRYAALVEASRAAVAALPDAVVGVAPHSLRAVTPDSLAAVLPLAQGGPIHIHIAEQVREVDDCLAWSGARPVQWLLDHAEVDRRWCLVHATHVTDQETQDLARSEAVAGLCPITEANLGDGIFPASEYQNLGGSYGIGSDSNIRIDMAEELRLLEYGQRLRDRARNLMAPAAGASTGRALFDLARRGGAQALGVDAIGGFQVGAPADVVTLKADHPGLVGRSGDAWLDALIFSGGPSMIDQVWRFGRPVVSGGVHHHRDEVATRFRTTLMRVLAS